MRSESSPDYRRLESSLFPRLVFQSTVQRIFKLIIALRRFVYKQRYEERRNVRTPEVKRSPENIYRKNEKGVTIKDYYITKTSPQTKNNLLKLWKNKPNKRKIFSQPTCVIQNKILFRQLSSHTKHQQSVKKNR